MTHTDYESAISQLIARHALSWPDKPTGREILAYLRGVVADAFEAGELAAYGDSLDRLPEVPTLLPIDPVMLTEKDNVDA